MKSLYMHLSSTIPELIQNIILVRENVVDISDKTMNELSNLINLTKNYQKNFQLLCLLLKNLTIRSLYIQHFD